MDHKKLEQMEEEARKLSSHALEKDKREDDIKKRLRAIEDEIKNHKQSAEYVELSEELKVVRKDRIEITEKRDKIKTRLENARQKLNARRKEKEENNSED